MPASNILLTGPPRSGKSTLIEEVVKKAEKEIDKLCKEAGERWQMSRQHPGLRKTTHCRARLDAQL